MAPKISSAEWEVMNVVWDHAPIIASEISSLLPPHHGWAQKTVNTFLARLVDKGILAAERSGKANVYTPLVPRDASITAESESFLKRVFKGATGELMLHFVENEDLSEADIAELQKMLRQKKGSSK